MHPTQTASPCSLTPCSAGGPVGDHDRRGFLGVRDLEVLEPVLRTDDVPSPFDVDEHVDPFLDFVAEVAGGHGDSQDDLSSPVAAGAVCDGDGLGEVREGVIDNDDGTTRYGLAIALPPDRVDDVPQGRSLGGEPGLQLLLIDPDSASRGTADVPFALRRDDSEPDLRCVTPDLVDLGDIERSIKGSGDLGSDIDTTSRDGQHDRGTIDDLTNTIGEFAARSTMIPEALASHTRRLPIHGTDDECLARRGARCWLTSVRLPRSSSRPV